MASSMKLEFPLNGALPSTEHARDRLLAKIFRFRRENQTFKDKAFVLLYAYSKTATYPLQMCIFWLEQIMIALVTGQISNEIREVFKEVESLFGTLNEDLLKLQWSFKDQINSSKLPYSFGKGQCSGSTN